MSGNRLPRITPSNVNDLECAKKFYDLHVLKKGSPQAPNRSAQFGIGLHAVLKNVYSPSNGIPPNVKFLDAYLKDAFFAIRYDGDHLRIQDIERCKRMVGSYISNDDEEDALGTIAVEKFASFPITIAGKPTFAISAKIDRVIVRETAPEDLVIRDYKTSQKSTNIKEAFVQLLVAKMLYPEYRTYRLEVEKIDEDGRVERDTISGSQVKGISGLIYESVLTKFARTDFPAEPGDACSYCPMWSECQEAAPVDLECIGKAFVDI